MHLICTDGWFYLFIYLKKNLSAMDAIPLLYSQAFGVLFINGRGNCGHQRGWCGGDAASYVYSVINLALDYWV